MARCPPFSLAILSYVEAAVEGTGTAPMGLEYFNGRNQFKVKCDYVVTATDRVVKYCGCTTWATPSVRVALGEALPTAL